MTVWANQKRRQVARLMHGESLMRMAFHESRGCHMGIGDFLWPGPQGLQEEETTTAPTKPTNLKIFKVCILENFSIGKELRKIQREEIILNIRGGQKGHLKARHDDGYDAMSAALCTLALGHYDACRRAEGHEQRTLLLKIVVFSMYKGIG